MRTMVFRLTFDVDDVDGVVAAIAASDIDVPGRILLPSSYVAAFYCIS